MCATCMAGEWCSAHAKYMPGHFDGDGCMFPDTGHFNHILDWIVWDTGRPAPDPKRYSGHPMAARYEGPPPERTTDDR